MAFDQHLADKITRIISHSKMPFYEKKMMGGITWMVDEKMCVGIFKNNLMARIDPNEENQLITKRGTSQMILGNKPMKGYLTITPDGFDFDADLEFWIHKCLEYNPKAKASKKKK